MIRNLCILAAFIGFYEAKAQSVLMEQDVNQDTIIPEKGPNRKHFSSVYFSGGFILGPQAADTSIQMDGMKSWEMRFGFYNKFKVTNWYSMVLDAAYHRQAFYTETESDITRYDKLIMNNVSAGFMNRINFGKRGDRVGNYLELGVSSDFAFMIRKKTYTTLDSDTDHFNSLKQTWNNPDYVNDLNYYGDVRLGFNHYVVYGRYRLSEIFNEGAKGAQMPVVSAGFMFDIGAK